MHQAQCHLLWALVGRSWKEALPLVLSSGAWGALPLVLVLQNHQVQALPSPAAAAAAAEASLLAAAAAWLLLLAERRPWGACLVGSRPRPAGAAAAWAACLAAWGLLLLAGGLTCWGDPWGACQEGPVR